MNNQVQPQNYTVKQYVKMDTVKERFEEVLGKRASQFTSSLVSLVNSNQDLKQASAASVVNSAFVAASLNLPVNSSLGYMYIVPYGKNAQPQIGYKGYIQLAQRSGKYKRINAIPVYEDEYGGWNPLTEELVYTPQYKNRGNEQPVGYYGSFELLNGFKKNVYWTWQQVDDHRKQFSQAGGKGNDKPKGIWAKHYDSMALKTVLKDLLTKWGPMTVDVQAASLADDGEYEHLEDESRRDVTPEDNSTTQAILDSYAKQQEQTKEVSDSDRSEAKPANKADQ